MASLAPGLVDLAALTTGDWSDRERAAIEDAYREALAPALREPIEAAAVLERNEFGGLAHGSTLAPIR